MRFGGRKTATRFSVAAPQSQAESQTAAPTIRELSAPNAPGKQPSTARGGEEI
jgi:hypothetical protein